MFPPKHNYYDGGAPDFHPGYAQADSATAEADAATPATTATTTTPTGPAAATTATKTGDSVLQNYEYKADGDPAYDHHKHKQLDFLPSKHCQGQCESGVCTLSPAQHKKCAAN